MLPVAPGSRITRCSASPTAAGRRTAAISRSPQEPSLHKPRPYPLGATLDGAGAGFTLYSQRASRVELCLFDDSGNTETARIALEQRAGGFWHTHVRDAGPGQLYASPPRGAGPPFAPSRTLLDPYARMVEGDILSGGGRCRLV